MCVNNLPKVATQWNSGATRDSNRGRRVLIPSALTTTPPSHTTYSIHYISQNVEQSLACCQNKVDKNNIGCKKMCTNYKGTQDWKKATNKSTNHRL